MKSAIAQQRNVWKYQIPPSSQYCNNCGKSQTLI